MQVFDMFGMFAQNVWLYGGAFILVLSVLVFVHEFGHYFAARRCGVRVDTFSIGFGKELFGITDKHGTRWKFSLIPLGGYVKMYGDMDPASAGHMNEEQAQEMSAAQRSEAFFAQSVAKRAIIVFAGPLINFLFAIVLLAIMYATLGQPVTPPVAAAIVGGSAAEQAGFMPHDEIIAIDGREIRRFEEIRRDVIIGLDQQRRFTVKRDDEVMEIIAAAEKVTDEDRFGFSQSRGLLGLISVANAIRLTHITSIDGIAMADADAVRAYVSSRFDQVMTLQIKRFGDDLETMKIKPLASVNQGLLDPASETYEVLFIGSQITEIILKQKPLEAVFVAVNETWTITTSTLNALGQMVTGTRSAKELGGLIRIGAMAGDMAQAGFIALVTFTALLSINLGLINLFPIPLLDGGHLVFYAAEALRGKPMPEAVQEGAFRLGLVFLIGIMVFANLNDIMQLIL